ncbi:zinc-ribbon domain-containing protein [Poseidonocella sp. HB161398]|uniref:zinc-ribbon domain-containing protein n=1 Tax=Poseidonocella sp. HB161398 TaxID=2320855 RepID=UPI001109B8A1|nr:zinc-ribbon domain-containing protein [Poseidonocella sp. HB161398]
MQQGEHAKVIRIICPACQAAYDVPQAAIAAGGRDVQCSACGHNWFQLWLPDRPAAGAEPAPAPPAASARESAPVPAPPVDPAEMAEDGPPLPSVLAGRARRAAPPAAPPPPMPAIDEEPELDLPLPPRRRLDPDVLAVLKAEAETETRARRREAEGMPWAIEAVPQPQARPRRSPSEVRDRLSRLQEAERGSEAGIRWRPSGENPGNEPDPEVEAPLVPPQGGFRPMPPLSDNAPAPDLSSLLQDRADIAPDPVLPDPAPQPGEIRSGLPVLSRSRALTRAEVQAAELRRGFRIGFFVPVALAAVLLALYLAAPWAAGRMPAAAPFLERIAAHGDVVQERLAGAILGVFGQEGPDGS